METALDSHRTLSFVTHLCDYTARERLKRSQFPRVVDAFLNQVLPREVFSRRTIMDLCGCGPMSMLKGVKSIDFDSPPQELLSISGRAPTREEYTFRELRVDARPTFLTEPFEVNVYTNFENFIGSHHIIHNLRTFHHGPIPNGLSLPMIGRDSRFELEHFRLGLELFHEAWNIRLENVPVGDQRLFVEATREDFVMFIEAESLKEGREFPLQKYDIFEKLCSIFHELFDYDLRSDYLRLARHKAANVHYS